VRGKFTAQPGKIKGSIDLPNQMIFGNRVSKMTYGPSWIDLAAVPVKTTESRLKACSKIGTNRTWRSESPMSGPGGGTDPAQQRPDML
jgi:hypothetical protein